MRKRIMVMCHGPLGVKSGSRDSYHVTWDDVWLRWTGKPGRRVYRAAPCLMTVREVEADMYLNEEVRRTSNEPTWYRDQDADYTTALKMVQGEGYGCVRFGAAPSIVTPALVIDRAEAERMLTWWLDHAHGIRNPKFSWVKTKYVIVPMGNVYWYQEKNATE